jgi:hypothetical protein
MRGARRTDLYRALRRRSVLRVAEPSHMEVGERVRTKRALDLGVDGKVAAGAIGVLESITNSAYMPFLVRFEKGTFAFQDGELEEVDGAAPPA